MIAIVPFDADDAAAIHAAGGAALHRTAFVAVVATLVASVVVTVVVPVTVVVAGCASGQQHRNARAKQCLDLHDAFSKAADAVPGGTIGDAA